MKPYRQKEQTYPSRKQGPCFEFQRDEDCGSNVKPLIVSYHAGLAHLLYLKRGRFHFSHWCRKINKVAQLRVMNVRLVLVVPHVPICLSVPCSLISDRMSTGMVNVSVMIIMLRQVSSVFSSQTTAIIQVV